MNSKTAAKPPRAVPANAKTRADNPANANLAQPLYLQIAQTLKEEILSGVYPVGSQLPTEDDLCQRFSVSRYTVREALRRLRDDGLILSRQGAGTTVVPPRTPNSYHLMSIDDLLTFVAAANGHFSIRSMKMITIDAALASRTGLTQGEEWLAIIGPAYTNGDHPFCWNEYYIHRDFAAVGKQLERRTVRAIFSLIEDQFGQRVVEVHQEISATPMTDEQSEALKVESGSPGLEVCRRFKLANGKIAQVSVSTHPASTFRHSMTLQRAQSQG